jgi:2-polyprenyl-6-methoxyphenol hydroxylase-like FAD-dependent oxidoreductase
MTARHRVVIVGGGFGGLAAAKALRRAPADVTVVDRPALLPLQRGITSAVLLGSISRRMSGREASDDETFAGAASAIAMGGDR